MSKQKKNSRPAATTIFILDKDTAFLAGESEGTAVYLKNFDFSEALTSIVPIRAVILLAELSWKDKRPEDFFGFNIAADLRVKYKLLCPFIILSSEEPGHFELLAAKEVKFKILFGRGTALLPLEDFRDHLDETINKLNEFPLSAAVLADMNEMLLNQKGVVIDKLTHDLKFGIQQKQLQKAIAETASYLSVPQLLALKWDFFCQELIVAEDRSKFDKTKQELLRVCEIELISDKKTIITEAPPRYQLLILEDDPDFRVELANRLEPHFEKLHITGNSAEAIAYLKMDTNNEIMAVISDWRIYHESPASHYWQLQGYEVLNYAAKKHFTALFGLTSLSDYNVHEIRNELTFNLQLFKKQHFIGGNETHWEILTDTVRQACDQVARILASQPTGEGWEAVKQQYFIERQFGWHNFESEVAEKATALFNYYFSAVDAGDQRNVLNMEDQKIYLKNNLKNILIIRRVFMGLYFILIKERIYLQDIDQLSLLGDGKNIGTELKHHAIDTFSLLRQDWWDDNATGKDSTDIKKIADDFDQRLRNMLNPLGIKLTEIPVSGLLPEEKSWFSNNNIDFTFRF